MASTRTAPEERRHRASPLQAPLQPASHHRKLTAPAPLRCPSQESTHVDGKAPFWRKKPRLRLSLTALLAASATVAAPVSAIQAAFHTPFDAPTSARCKTLRADPHEVLRLWIRTTAQGKPSPCPLAAPTYHDTEPPFGTYSIALGRPLKPEPRHQLYLILLVGKTRIGRYVLDLCPDTNHRWLVDLWAEL